MNSENNKELNNYITKYYNQIDNIYIDKFWSSINNKHWIYVDDVLIEWIGYKKDSCGKQKYTNIIKDNFKENKDYKIYNYEEINKVFHSSLEINENNKEILTFKDKLTEIHNRTLHLILSPKCFKKSLMMIRTEKANLIRDYYVDIEEICLEFNKYLLENNKKELEEKENIINEQKINIIQNQNELFIDKFSNKKCIYLFEIIDLHNQNKYIKIGSTKDIPQRFLTLKQKFKQLNILNIFECSNNYIEIEQDILNDDYIKNNLYKDLINGNKSIEIVKITENCTYDSIISIVKKYLNNIYALNPIQILENKKLDIDSKKINLINRLLDNGYNPNEIINKLFNNEINFNTTHNNDNNYTVKNTNSEIIKIQYIKPTKKPNSKAIYKVNPNTLEVIKKYNTLAMLLIEEEILDVKQKGIYNAIRNNLIYKNYRWVYEDTEIKPTYIPIYNKKNKITNNTSHIETIIKLNNTQDEIINTYPSLTALTKLEKISINTIKKYISNNIIYKNYYYIYLKDCKKTLIDNYISNGNIINKYKANHCKIIIKYDPINNLEFKYESLTEALLKNHIRSTKLKHAITNDILVDGFKWRYG